LRARVSLGISPDGKRSRKYIYGRTKLEVQKKLRAAHNANDAGRLPTPNKTTVAEYLKFWIENISRAAESTKDRYQADITKHINPLIGKVKLQQLTGLHIDSVISAARDNELSPRSQQHIFSCLNKTLNDAVKRDLIGFNPCAKSDKPRLKKKKHTVWTSEQSQAFLKHVSGHRWFALFTLAMFTGMRQGEALALFWTDIDWDKNEIRIVRTLTDRKGKATIGEVPKTEAGDRAIIVPPYVMDALDKHRAKMMMDGHPTSGDKLVFVNHAGSPVDVPEGSHIVGVAAGPVRGNVGSSCSGKYPVRAGLRRLSQCLGRLDRNDSPATHQWAREGRQRHTRQNRLHACSWHPRAP
jgi:integrase